MKGAYLTLGFLITLSSCSSPATPTEKTLTSEAPKETTSDISYEANLEAYRDYISTLDTSKAETVTLAADKYKELFDDQAALVLRDQGFAEFEKYYARVLGSLEYQISDDSKIQDVPCEQLDENGREMPMDKNLKKFLAKVEKHGFRLECWEGFPGIGMDRSFVEKNFYALVSPAMKSYLIKIAEENEDQFSADAGIIISEKQFIDRTVSWEKFIAENPDFGMLDQAKARYKNLFTYLLIGMDNTPSIGFDTETERYVYRTVIDLDDYFVNAYTYLNKAYPKSETNKLVAPFFAAAKKKDVPKINKLMSSYLKQRKLIDFETEYGSEK